MKKVLSAVLASAMVASMGASAFAATADDSMRVAGIYSTPMFIEDYDVTLVDTVPYGETFYYALYSAGSECTHDANHPLATDTDLDYYEATCGYVKGVACNLSCELGEGVHDDDCPKFEDSDSTDDCTCDSLEVNVHNNDCIYVAGAECQHSTDAHNTNCGYTGMNLVSSYDYAKYSSLKQSWEMNSSLVSKIELVKTKIISVDGVELPATEKGYYYFVAVTTKSNNSTTANDLIGTITLRKTGTYAYVDGEISVPVNVELSYAEESGDYMVTDKTKTFTFEDGNTEECIYFEKRPNDYFIVDTCDQGDINLRVTSTYNAELAAKFPEANIDFFNGNYATFNRTGELTLAASAGTENGYVYAVAQNGAVSSVKVEYDEYEEAFKIKTRTLGVFMISDVELDLNHVNTSTDSSSSSSSSNESTVDDSRDNPLTGAVA